MCREGAWVELTIEVTSVDDDTTQTARIFFIFLNIIFAIFKKNIGLYAIEYKVKQ